MALNKLKFNSLNVTPTASEAIRFNSSANGLETASAGGALVKISTTTIKLRFFNCINYFWNK